MTARSRSGARLPVRIWSGSTGTPSTTEPSCPARRWGCWFSGSATGPGRVHLDIHTDDPAAELARLEKLGAELVEQVNAWWIMRDPAGLVFCVVPEHPGALNDSNAQRWD